MDLPGDSFWVEERRLLAGPYPGDPDPEREIAKLGGFLDVGIRRFVDLTEPGEHAPYEPALLRMAAERGVDVSHVRMAIPDERVPTRGRMREILGLLEADLAQREPVYVHCRGGAGRTGTVVGCYLVERGLAPGDALAQLTRDRLHLDPRRRSWSSPETAEQRRFVLAWQPRSSPSA